MKNICTSDGQFRVWCKQRWQYLNAQKRWCSKLMALVESVARCAAFADKPEKYLFVETKEQDRLNVRSKLFTRSLASQLTDVLAHKGGYAIIIDAWYKIGTCLIYYNQAQVTVKVLWRHVLRNPLTVTQYYLNIHANTFQLQCKIDPCNFLKTFCCFSLSLSNAVWRFLYGAVIFLPICISSRWTSGSRRSIIRIASMTRR